jgi:hypothetical protein
MCVVLALLLLVEPLIARNWDGDSWQNLSRLTPGQSIEVTNRVGKSLKGTLINVAENSIHLRQGQQDVTIPHAEVSRVQLRTKGSRKAMWIGLGLGAGAGAGIGAGVGAGLADRSGGDFSNLQPAMIGVFAGVGVLAGLAIGSVIDKRHNIIYSAK